MIDTYLMRRPSLVGTTVRQRGEPVPEAHLWRLVEGMVRSGRLVTTRMSESDFAAALAKYCPGDTDAVNAKLGLESVQVPAMRRGRQRGERTVLTSPPTLIDAGA